MRITEGMNDKCHKKKVYRPPLISFKEIADSLDITTKMLNGYISHSKIPFPKSVSINGSVSRSNVYYHKTEVVEWIKNNNSLCMRHTDN